MAPYVLAKLKWMPPWPKQSRKWNGATIWKCRFCPTWSNSEISKSRTLSSPALRYTGKGIPYEKYEIVCFAPDFGFGDVRGGGGRGPARGPDSDSESARWAGCHASPLHYR